MSEVHKIRHVLRFLPFGTHFITLIKKGFLFIEFWVFFIIIYAFFLIKHLRVALPYKIDVIKYVPDSFIAAHMTWEQMSKHTDIYANLKPVWLIRRKGCQCWVLSKDRKTNSLAIIPPRGYCLVAYKTINALNIIFIS